MDPRMSRFKTDQPMGHHPMPLRQWEELVGECIGLSVEDESLLIRLRANGQNLLLLIPICQNAGISTAVAKKWLGKKIGVLKTDDPVKTLAVRIIGKEHINDPEESNRVPFFRREVKKGE